MKNYIIIKTVKLFVLVFIFLLFCKNSYGQSYQKMLGTSNEWYQIYVGEGFASTLLWRTTADTVIDSYKYRKVEFFSTSGNIYSDCHGFIREDSIMRKIYYRYCGAECALPCDTSDLTIYDFSGAVGDTVLINLIVDFPTPQRSFIIDSIRLDTSFSSNRIYYLHGTDDINWQLSWVEGVGSLTGLEDNLSLAGNSSLLCAFKDSIQTFQSYDNNFPGQCIINTTGVKESMNLPFVKISPNPTTSVLKIETTEPSVYIQSVSLLNLTGQELIHGQVQNQPQSTILSTQLLAPGIYFCRITLSNGERDTKKVIIK